MSVSSVKTVADLEALRDAGRAIAVNYCATWCEPCVMMNDVFGKLAARHSQVCFVSVDVDTADEALTERFNVTAVPTYLLLSSDLTLRARVDGADAARLTSMLDGSAAVSVAGAVDEMAARLDALTTQQPVMLMMKGSPDEPECGFSAKIVALLKNHAHIPYGHFNILSDSAVRQSLKVYANFPTYPQLWADGKLIG
eukprot:TRINITY_DN2396_c0_g1_i1.p1 TRINITY_DN2396_c0_g1~~TRINITY_DN2396_c0_g1_i1.p1  ORF type:complete len:211 (-),score=63.59 TRINITY_DN2396_c0_g1_i1:84-674(-)